jgi:hypothetical protein
LRKQVTVARAAKVKPLAPAEEDLWRAVMRLVKLLPRHLDSDLSEGPA